MLSSRCLAASRDAVVGRTHDQMLLVSRFKDCSIANNLTEL